MDANKNAVVLKRHKPISTSGPSIDVRGLVLPGEYRFRLVVVDRAGNHSQPAIVSILVDEPVTMLHKFRVGLARLLRWFTNLPRH